MTALEVYSGSDGELTKRFYGELEKRGPIGVVALNLFRAQKCSSRAKVYRGGVRGHGSYRSMAYDRKSWSMENLAEVLTQHAESLGIPWGWRQDVFVKFGEKSSWVMYIDLPFAGGQVSFHSPTRGNGPEYPHGWDGQKLSAERIIQFCDRVLAPPPDER